MANQTSFTIKGNVVVDGLKQSTTEAKKLNAELSQIAKTSQPKAAAQSKSLRAAKEASELTQYGVTRSIRPGGTGASARDFAQEAQGLGGLVRLYATYAANVFAASAAFTALSNAMDTANMVKGLDQLGAASGTALGSLSKRFVAATDGAVSLREAMESVTKASSSGISDKDILRIAKGAKQASQALGVDMSDAVSRLTRGITKLEPELLDELGIFVRVDDATKEYAKSVGKAASELTDFERRMAFAQAALTQVDKKFGDIELDTNPYTKLLATVRDTTQNILELINKGIAPLVNLLAESPTALTALIAGLSVMFVKQALPAIGEFRNGLKASAEQALETARVFKESFGDEFQSRLEQRFKIPDIEKQIRKVEADLGKISFAGKMPKSLASLMDGDEKSLANVNRLLENRNNIVSTGMRGSKQASDAQIQAAKQEIVFIEKAIQLYNLKQQKAEAFGSLEEVAGKTQSALDPEIVAIRRYQQLQEKVASSTAVSNAAQNAQILGIRGSWILLNKEISENGITGFAKYSTIAQGGLAAIASRVLGLASAFSNIGAAVGIAITAFSFISDFLSKNNKQLKEFEDSTKLADESVANLGRTVDNINSKPFGLQFSTESLEARAKALMEVSDSINTLANNLEKADKNANWWDRFIDGWKSIWGGDLASKFAESTSKGLFSTLTKLSGTKEAESLKKELNKILDIDPSNFTLEELEKAIESATKTAPEKLNRIKEAFNEISKASQISTAKSIELADSFKKLGEIRTTIFNSFIPKDDVTKFGLQLVSTFQKLSIALEDPEQKLNAIVLLSKEISQIPGTDISQVLGMQALAKDAERVQKSQAELLKINQDLIDKEAELAKLLRDNNKARKIASGIKVNVSGLTMEGIKELNILKKELQSLQSSKEIKIKVNTELTGKIDASNKQIESAQLSIFKAGANILSTQLSAEWAKAGTTIANAYASVLSGTETGIKMRAQADRAVINAQIAQIESQRNLTIATRELSIQMQEAELRQEKQNSSGRLDLALVSKKEKELERAKIDLANVKSGNVKGLTSKLSKDLETAGAQMSKVGVEGLDFAASMEASSAAIANLKAQLAAINIGEEFQLFDVGTKERISQLQTELSSLEIAKDKASLLKIINGETSKEYIDAKQALEQQILEKQQTIEQFTILREIEKYSKAGAKSEAEKAKQKLVQLQSQQKEKSILLASNQLVERVTANFDRQNLLAEREAEKNRQKYDYIAAQLQAEEAIFNAKNSAGIIDAKSAILAKQLLEAKKEELSYQTQLNQISEQYRPARQDLSRRETIIKESGQARGYQTPEELTALQQISEERTRINSIIDSTISKLQQQKETNLEVLNITNKAALSQQYWNEALADMQDVGEGLKSLFADLGDSISNFGKALIDLVRIQEQNTNKQIENQKALANAETSGDWDRWFDLQDEKDRLRKKSEQDELSGYIKTASAAKSMFSEKTAAYKAFYAIEKALAIARIALSIKEMVTDTTKTAAEVSNSGIRTGVKLKEAAVSGGKAILEALSAPFPIGFVTGAAMAAIVASILSSIGGGKTPKVNTKVGGYATSEQQQQVQGTGQAYVEGKLVQTGYGKLGDSSAKSTDVADSIDMLEKYSKTALNLDNKALNALKAIERNTKDLAAAFAKIPGITTGSAFGTEEKSGGNWLFGKTSTTIEDTGIELKGTVSDIIKGVGINLYEVVKKQSSGFLGLFASESVKLKSENLLDVEGVADETKTRVLSVFKDMFVNLNTAIVELGKSFNVDVSEELMGLLDDPKFTEDFKLSLKGMSGEEAIEAISAQVGVTGNKLVEALFPFVREFQEMGEGFVATLTRLTTQLRTATDQFAKLGVDIDKILPRPMVAINDATAQSEVKLAKARLDSAKQASETFDYIEEIKTDMGEFTTSKFVEVSETPEEKIELQKATDDYTAALAREKQIKYENIEANMRFVDNLIKVMGGVEEFNERMTFINENFTPTATKVAAATKSWSEAAEELGIQSSMTREEFYQLTKSALEAGESGQALFVRLTELAPAFDELKNQTEDFLNEYGISVSGLKNIFLDTLTGRMDFQEAGVAIVEMLTTGMYNALAGNFADQITNVLIDGFIQPMIYNTVNQAAIGQGLVEAMAVSSAEDMAKKVKAIADAYELLFNSQEFQDMLKTIPSLVNSIMGSLSGVNRRVSTARAISAGTAINKVQEERVKLEEQLLSILGDTAKLRERELASISASNRPLQLRIWAIEDSKAALDKALDTFKRSIDVQKDTLNKQLNDAVKIRDNLQNVFDILKTNIDELLGIASKDMQVAEAQALLRTSIATGILPESEKLSQAVSTLKDSVESGIYVSKVEEQKARLSLANQLSTLQALAKPQLSEAEQTVLALETQITRLDEQLEFAQKQVDLLNGIDNSVFEVAVAVDRLNTALTGYRSQLVSAKGEVASGVEIAQVTAVPKFANGGLADQGVALVGEKGPELVNFEKPGMVYTAAETNNLLNSKPNAEQEKINKALLEQIALLRYEAQATAIHTGKLQKILERVTRDGKSILVTDSTTV